MSLTLDQIHVQYYVAACHCYRDDMHYQRERENKNVRSQSERGLLCISVMTFARAVAVIM